MLTSCQSLYSNSTREHVYISGDAVLDETDGNLLPIWTCVTICFVYIVILRLVGYIALRTIRNPTKTGIR